MKCSDILNIASKEQYKKAEKFLKNGSIIETYIDPSGRIHRFKCIPINGYNVTTYNIIKYKNGSYTCTCQYYRTSKQVCSHILAVAMFERSEVIL